MRPLLLPLIAKVQVGTRGHAACRSQAVGNNGSSSPGGEEKGAEWRRAQGEREKESGVAKTSKLTLRFYFNQLLAGTYCYIT